MHTVPCYRVNALVPTQNDVTAHTSPLKYLCCYHVVPTPAVPAWVLQGNSGATSSNTTSSV